MTGDTTSAVAQPCSGPSADRSPRPRTAGGPSAPLSWNGQERRRFVSGSTLALGAALLPSGALAAEAGSADGFRFIFMTDPHVQPERGAVAGTRQCIEAINARSPAFVITGGDLIMDALEVGPERLHLQWRLWDECIATLQCPTHHTIGNHDVCGWSPKAIVKPGDADYGKKFFAERYGQGRTYRSFDHAGWHFVLLDSVGQNPETLDYKGWIDDEQAQWLKADLEQAGRRMPTVLVTHIPFFSVWHQALKGPAFALDGKALVGNVHALRGWLKDYNIRLVLSGHGHLHERIELGGVTYLQGGAVSGLWWKGRVNGDPEGFVEVDCRPDGTFRTQHVGYGWTPRG
jgi:Icc protein